MNLSNFSGYSGASVAVEIRAEDIVRDYASKIDDKVILAVFLMLVAWTLSFIILPRALQGVKYMLDMPMLTGISPLLKLGVLVLDFGIGLMDTFVLGSALFIFGLAYIQGLIPVWMLVVVFVLLGIVVLLFLGKVYVWIRDKGWKKSFEKLRDVTGDNDASEERNNETVG